MAMIIAPTERSITAALGSGKSSLTGVKDELDAIRTSLSVKLTSAVMVPSGDAQAAASLRHQRIRDRAWADPACLAIVSHLPAANR